MRILIIRHGDPDYVNDTLTEKGRREATLLAEKLSKEKIDGVLVVFARSMMIFTIISLSVWIYKSYQLNVPLSEWLIISKKIIGGTNVYKIVYSWCNYYHPTYIAVSLCMAQAIYYYRTSTKVNGTSVHYVETLLFIILIISSSALGNKRGWDRNSFKRDG